MLSRLKMLSSLSDARSDMDGTDESEIYSAQLVLEMLEVALIQGLSLPRCLVLVGKSIHGPTGMAFTEIGERLREGENWDHVWRAYLQANWLISLVHDVLEPSWKRGVSPLMRIESSIQQINSSEAARISSAAHELSVRILLPLGLCFLPGFIIIAVIPLLSSWQFLMQ